MTIFKVAAALLLLLFSTSQALSQSPSAIDLLSMVGKANRDNNYRGFLTYEANGYMSTLQLKHYVEGDVSHQRLEFLDGPKRKVIRRQGLYHCDSGQTRWGLWPNDFDTQALTKVYRIELVGNERVAGRDAHIISVVSKDDYRYGYRFSIDQNTGLLLKTLLIVKDNVIERLQFIDINLLQNADSLNSLEVPSIGANTENDAQNEQVFRVPEVEPCRHDHYQSAWQVGWLPKGFVSVGNRVTDQGEQVLMFSDGLATISVFIHDKSYAFLPKATARRGATVAVMSPVEHPTGDYTVVVVGEVPKVTARQVAISVTNTTGK